MDEVKGFVKFHREKLRKKNTKKVEHLVKKYGKMTKTKRTDMTKEIVDMVGHLRMFKDDISMVGETVKEPIIVTWVGETLELSEDERELLKLGPKYCVYSSLNEENFILLLLSLGTIARIPMKLNKNETILKKMKTKRN